MVSALAGGFDTGVLVIGVGVVLVIVFLLAWIAFRH